jgi:hypothetical protein
MKTVDFSQIVALIKSGQRDEARQRLLAILKNEPDNEIAWQWMYSVCRNDEERIGCLKRILQINPSNSSARLQLEKLQGTAVLRPQPVVTPKPVPSKNKNIYILIAAIAFMLVVCCCIVFADIPSGINVKYVVSGSASSASITYFNETGGMEQINNFLPFEKSMNVSLGSPLSLVAQNGGSGTITCEIWMDNKLIKTSTSTAQYGIVTCADFAH